MKFLDNILAASAESPWLVGMLGLISVVLFIVNPVLGLIAFALSAAVLYVLGSLADDGDDDYFTADDPKDGGFPKQPDTAPKDK